MKKSPQGSGSVLASLLGVPWRILEAYGVPPGQVIPRAQYRPGAAGGATQRISLEDYLRILERVAERVPDPAVGLRAGQLIHPSHLGALGHAFMASATLREAIERAARYHRMLLDSVTLEVSAEGRDLKAAYRLDSHGTLPEIRLDSMLASLLHLCRLNFGAGLTPVAVHMRRPAPDDPGPWERAFGIPVAFGEAEDALVLRGRDVDRQLTVSNPQLASVHEEILQRQLAALDRADVVNRAQVAMLEMLPSGSVTEEAVADRLGMTPRTLYNRLHERGAAFRTLLSELRKRLAERYLSDPTYSITEISFLLGYSDTSAFSRAFRGWHGMSPSRFRETGGAG